MPRTPYSTALSLSTLPSHQALHFHAVILLFLGGLTKQQGSNSPPGRRTAAFGCTEILELVSLIKMSYFHKTSRE